MEKSAVLERGLAVLEFMARRQTAGLSEVADALALSLPAASRALEALRAAGYLQRARSRDAYRLTAKLTRLGAPHRAELLVRDAARPLMAALAREVGCALLLGLREGVELVVLEATSAPGLRLPAPGTRLPYFQSAAGTVSVAFLPPREREAVLQASAGLRRKHELAYAPTRLEHFHARARSRGFIEHDAVRGRQASIAVPLGLGSQGYGLEAVYAPAKLSRAAVVRRVLPELKRIAAAVAAEALKELG